MSRNIKIINKKCNFKVGIIDSIKDRINSYKKKDIDDFKEKIELYLDKILDGFDELNILLDDGIDKIGDELYSYYDTIKGKLENFKVNEKKEESFSFDKLKPMMSGDMNIDRGEAITGLKEFKKELLEENIENINFVRNRSRGSLSISLIIVIFLIFFVAVVIGINVIN